MKYSEEELVRLLQNSHEQDFPILYDCYSRSLYGIIRKIISEESVAEDVLQEVFLKIWNNSSKYDPSEGRLFTWMVNIARNTSIDRLRSKNQDKLHLGRNEENNNDKGLINFSETKTDHPEFKGIFRPLSTDQRKLIDLVYFSGYTQEEISRNLCIPIITVKTRMRSALMELRKTTV